MSKSSKTNVFARMGAMRQDSPPPDVKPRYQAMAYWTPRNMRRKGKGGKA